LDNYIYRCGVFLSVQPALFTVDECKICHPQAAMAHLF